MAETAPPKPTGQEIKRVGRRRDKRSCQLSYKAVKAKWFSSGAFLLLLLPSVFFLFGWYRQRWWLVMPGTSRLRISFFINLYNLDVLALLLHSKTSISRKSRRSFNNRMNGSAFLFITVIQPVDEMIINISLSLTYPPSIYISIFIATVYIYIFMYIHLDIDR